MLLGVPMVAGRGPLRGAADVANDLGPLVCKLLQREDYPIFALYCICRQLCITVQQVLLKSPLSVAELAVSAYYMPLSLSPSSPMASLEFTQSSAGAGIGRAAGERIAAVGQSAPLGAAAAVTRPGRRQR